MTFSHLLHSSESEIERILKKISFMNFFDQFFYLKFILKINKAQGLTYNAN